MIPPQLPQCVRPILPGRSHSSMPLLLTGRFRSDESARLARASDGIGGCNRFRIACLVAGVIVGRKTMFVFDPLSEVTRMQYYLAS